MNTEQSLEPNSTSLMMGIQLVLSGSQIPFYQSEWNVAAVSVD